jgi:hypothetical protein
MKHMDIGSRNARLRETLEGMGLYVQPIFSDEDLDQIDFMHVSAALPSYVTQSVPQETSCVAVATPMASAEVGDVISAAEGGRANVIDLPAAFRIRPVL